MHGGSNVSDRLLTTEEVANYLAKPRSWIDGNAERLKIPRIRMGNHYRYRLSDVDAWLDSLKVSA
jgi:excisionase family DNA binding protein